MDRRRAQIAYQFNFLIGLKPLRHNIENKEAEWFSWWGEHVLRLRIS